MKYTAKRKTLISREVSPIHTKIVENKILFMDFGKAAFGTLKLSKIDSNKSDYLIIHLGEKLNSNNRIDRNPPGTIQYQRLELDLKSYTNGSPVPIPPNSRNTGPGAIKMPEDLFEVYPFRYVEIENIEEIKTNSILQVIVEYPFDDLASSFTSSNKIINSVWDLCKHSIKATTFCGVYVDGDRERIPYEGDSYINQLSHYAVDREYKLARYTNEYLIQNPTWPTEWQFHTIMIAWADYLYTGNIESLEMFYDDLSVKTLIELSREDGLISTFSEKCTVEFEKELHLYKDNYIFNHGLKDLVDWPPGSFTKGGQGERDNHEMLPINTVINAFHCNVLKIMSSIAGVLGKNSDQNMFKNRAELVKDSLNRLLFDKNTKIYVDGEGSNHSSLHSNMFMLAFDLVPNERKAEVVSFIKSKGMACSVYGSQYLLEALYKNNEDQFALELMTATHDRSWWNMIKSGSTITMEAWDLKYKKNLDWNHAWGAAPANIISRFLLGVRPLEAGFKRVLIAPMPGDLISVSAKIPTIAGPIEITIDKKDKKFKLDVKCSTDIVIEILLPKVKDYKPEVFLNGNKIDNWKYRHITHNT